MSQVINKSTTKTRTATKQVRRLQLIKATIRSIAMHGLSVTTMSTVAKEAGLSQGIINLHFKSKDRLLEETLRFVVDEYRQTWFKASAISSGSAEEKLSALVAVDFKKHICQRNKLAVWFAFWGESRSRPIYRQICAERDTEYRQVLKSLCEELIKEGNYACRADQVAIGLTALNQGLWLDLLLKTANMTPDMAHKISIAYLGNTFPQHFKD